MIEGLWIVQYEGMRGNGGGVVVFVKGRAFGGDNAFTYVGDYQVKGDSITALVTVRNFLAGVPSILGVAGDFQLEIQGTVDGGTIRGKGRLQRGEAVGIALKLTKRADLPA